MESTIVMCLVDLKQKCIDKYYLKEYRLELIDVRENKPRSQHLTLATSILKQSKISTYDKVIDMSKSIEAIISQLNKLINSIETEINSALDNAVEFEKQTMIEYFNNIYTKRNVNTFLPS